MQRRSFPVAVGTYDFQAQDCNHNVLDTQWNQTVSGTTDWTITGGSPPAGNATIILHNNSGQTVVYAYISACSDTSW